MPQIHWTFDRYGRRVSRPRAVYYRQARDFVNPDGTPYTPKPDTLTPLYSRDYDVNRFRSVIDRATFDTQPIAAD